MTQPIDHAESLPTGLAGRINPVCDRFEAAWRSGERPRLEDYLPQAEAADQPWLLRELLRLEVDYRGPLGEKPTAAEYRLRFPEHAELIDGVFGGFSTNRAPEPPSPVEGGTVSQNGSSAAAPAAAVLRLPGYEILGELGRGGMGVVYQARQLGFNRIVALKMILSGAHAGAEDLARFRIEAEAVARLQHPNIVQVYEVGEHDGKPFFSMEFCPGGGLDKKLNGTPLPPKEAAALMETLARAVQAAHDKGVVHRDLKPANVLLAEDGTPKVTDFGLAKQMDAEGRTATGAVMGTPSYMAPEQAGGAKHVGPGADVYALGAILYECLVGRPPFKAPTALETLVQVMAQDPVLPRQLQPKTPRDLETICLKCLEKTPARRYATAAELADDLGRYLAGKPVRARPASLGYVLGKWTWRRRAPLAVAAGMLLLLTAVVVGAFVQILGARDTAQKNYETADKNGKALQVALNEKQQTLDSLHQQLSLLASSYADKSEAAYQAGTLRDSLNWMLRAYEVAPDKDPPDPLRPSYLRLIAGRGRGLSDLTLWHDGPVYEASFSPDGRTIVTVSDDKTARLWDATSGKELHQLPHDDIVQAASFSPDGHMVVTASYDKTARLWDAASGKELHKLPNNGQGLAASFSPDSRTVLTVSGKTAWLWDAASGEELHELTHDGAVWSASFSPDGRTVVTASWNHTALPALGASTASLLGSALGQGPLLAASALIPRRNDKTARLWDVASGKELTWLKKNVWARAVSFSPDGRTVLTVSGKTARLWDAATGNELQRLTHEGEVNTASFSPDGRTVLTVSGKAVWLWDAASGKEPQRLTHEGEVNTASFSPDGRTVLTTSTVYTVRPAGNGLPAGKPLPPGLGADLTPTLTGFKMALWDAASGKELRWISKNVWARAVSFSPDGRTVVAFNVLDHRARLFDAANGQELQQVTHEGMVYAASFSPDGRTVLTASDDKTARLWDATRGRELQRLPHDVPLPAASFSPDGRTVVIADSGKTARLWDAASDKETAHLTKETRGLTHDDSVNAASFSPDGHTVLTASNDKTARLWDATTGKELHRFPHDGPVRTATFSPDGHTVLTASDDRTARLWGVQSGEELHKLPHDGQVLAASFSPDGRTVLTVSDKTARLWDAANGKELYKLPHDSWVLAASFSPDGHMVVTASADKTARLWDAANGKELYKLPHDSWVLAASFSPDGHMVVTASADKSARLWDAANGKELYKLPHDSWVLAASFSPDGHTVLTASHDGMARLWDASTGQVLQKLTHDSWVLAASFSPDGRTVVTASNDGTARLWDAASGGDLGQWLSRDYWVLGPDGRTVVTSYDKTALLWDAASGKELQRLTHDGSVNAASFSPDGRIVLTASNDKTARLWDAASGKELYKLTHDDQVYAASFSPDGRTVLTASNDKTARLWDAASGKELLRLPHEYAVMAASFSPDGRTVVTASGTVRLWDAATGKKLQELSPAGAPASFSPDGRTVLTGGGSDICLWDAVSGKELQRLTLYGLVEAPSFSPDGRTVVTARASFDKDQRPRLYDVGFLSVPDEVDLKRLRAWVRLRTGQDFTAEGTLYLLSKEEREQQRQNLDAEGGDWQTPPDPQQWHLAQAANAEADQAWFAARFHLNRLLMTDPTNADLLRRRDEAEAHLKAP